MFSLNKLGNTEILKCFEAIHCKYYGILDDKLKNTKYYEEYNNIVKRLLRRYQTLRIEDIYYIVYEELRQRGLEGAPKRDMYEIAGYSSFRFKMRSTPTYIREIRPTNFKGGDNILIADDVAFGFDYPVIEACKLLDSMGYVPYWSSANKDDFNKRKNLIEDNISAAFILIDSECLNNELKERLLLKGSCNFWGNALEFSDDGKYYGIYTEINSINDLCDNIKKSLINEAEKLPKQDKKVKSKAKIFYENYGNYVFLNW